MPLPIIPLPSSTVEVNGSPVTFRSLSRSEALKLRGMQGREDEAEVMIVAWACDTSEDDARLFLSSTTVEEAGKLSDAILIFSGLADADEEGEPIDPKAASNDHSWMEVSTLTPS